ncbi:MAG: hypothetical protein DI530_08835 [Sphingomonas sp.]|uniref:hypothetical protein n=1 Tax=Sphingomonas sp. TaxID=28214 RepID=UPI000DBBE974|nr:hypothetical protein [Sphingomonas sp.]PZU79336.1 MAG: hypothetical protein DI530_08835 [Sphingomonas sp.]
MIDRIGSLGALPPALGTPLDTAPARAGAAALVDALTAADPIGTPLRALAGDAAATIAQAIGRTDPVGTAELDRATLDFAREAKAFAIGHGERGTAGVRAALAEALALGEGDASALPGADPLGQAVTLFTRAAAHLRQL